jgi:VWFA-related protein
MLKRFQKIISYIVVSTFFVGAVGQQRPETSQDERVRVITNLVQLDVVVTDDQGEQVTDLRPEDFEVTEDGKRQTITNFSYVGNAPTVPTAVAKTTETGPSPAVMGSSVPPAVLRPDKVRRVVTVLVDDLGISFESMNYVRKALRELIETKMEPGDLFAILRTSGGVGALQQFTTDKRLLMSAIDSIRWLPRGRGDITPFDSSISATGEMVTDLYTREAVQDMQMSKNEILAAGTIGTLNLVLRALEELPGRKSVVLFTENTQIIDFTGNRSERLVKLMKQLADYSNRASAVVYTVDTSGLQPLAVTAANSPGNARVISDRLGSMGSVAQSRNPSSNDRTVLGNPEEGLRALDNLATARRSTYFESQGVLKYLADLTGGIAIKNTNDVAGSLGRVLDDARGYYLIGYRPEEATIDPKTGQRRQLKIGVKVKRPNLKVRARSGFYGLTDEEKTTKKLTREEQLRAALNTPFAGDVRVRLTPLFTDEAAGSFVRAMVHVDARDLKFAQTADTNKADLELVVLTLDSSGNLLDEASRVETVTAKSDALQRILSNGLTYFLNVPVRNPGGYQVRVAVRDVASEKTGSASQYVAVPDLSRGGLALSGLLVSGMSLAAATTNAKEEPNPQAGPVVRRLKRGMVLEYGYLIYNATIEKATGKPQVTTQMRIFKDGRPVFTGRIAPLDLTSQTDMKRLIAGGRMQIGSDMALGDYVIQVTATDNLIKEKDKEKRRTVSQWIDFEVTN